MREAVSAWLRQGISPFRLALTLALGFAIGCIPVVGVPTLLCAAVAIGFELNLPAIQAANYAAMPLQLVLILPFLRLGQWIFAWGPSQALSARTLFALSPLHLAPQLGWLAAEAVLAWMLVAVPAVTVMTATLTPLFKRIPAFSSPQSAD